MSIVTAISRGNSSAQLALGRVTRQLEKVTDELIRSLFVRTRMPSPELDAKIAELELRRDELHERLATLEEWASNLGISTEMEPASAEQIAS